MKKFFILYIIGVLLFSCKDPYEGTTFTAYEELPMASYLSSRPDDFSLWVDLLKHTNLYNTFNLFTEYTAFVPNDSAMQEYMTMRGINSVTELDSVEASTLVKYHTLLGTVLEQSEFTTGAIDWPTVTDDNLSIVFKEGGINQIYLNNTSRIVELDIKVVNGIIHVLDEVLIPVTETIYKRLESEDYTILKSAIDACAYADLLNTVSVEAEDEEGNPIEKRYFYTLFSVKDATYNAMGINSLDDLKTELAVSGSDYANPENELNKYVAYHILSQINSSADLSTIEEGQSSRNINTLAPKELINLSLSELNLIQINFNETTGAGTSLIDYDITCKNGVIHEIDTWMPVTTPPTTVVDWDLADYADLGAICDYFQSPNPYGGSGTYQKVVPVDEVAAYDWEAIPQSKTDVITYVNNRNNDGLRYNAMFHDHLNITTGAGGWVEIESPVIVKGTYKITIYYISYLSANNDGNMQCYLDGSKLGSSFFISNTSQERLSNKVLSTSYTFSETDQHSLRIVGIDGKSLRLDYIKLEPLN